MSMSMYEHYCHFSGMIILDGGITTLIAHCLGFLGLPQWCADSRDVNKEALSLTVVENRREETSKSVFVHSRALTDSSVERGIRSDHHETRLEMRSEGFVVTDSLTAEKPKHSHSGLTNTGGRPPATNYIDLTVNRDCETRESSSTEDSPEPVTDASGDSFEVKVDTADPCVIIQHLEQETVAISSDRLLSQTISDLQSHLRNVKVDPSHKVQGN